MLIFFGEVKYSLVDAGAGVDIDVLNINEAGPVKLDTSSSKITKLKYPLKNIFGNISKTVHQRSKIPKMPPLKSIPRNPFLTRWGQKIKYSLVIIYIPSNTFLQMSVPVNLNRTFISCVLNGLTTMNKFSASRIIRYSTTKHENKFTSK